MKLFEIDDDDKQVMLNKPFIHLVPEFAALLRRDKGSKGDSEGRSKLKARKEFTFIYMMIDFGSPIRDWDLEEKRKESLVYAGLEEADIDAEVTAALEKYRELFFKSARSLKTYQAMLASVDKIDTYFTTVDLIKTNGRGELVHSVTELINAGKKAEEYYIALSNMEKRVEEQLTAGAKTIRGTAELGDNETKVDNKWDENEVRNQGMQFTKNTGNKFLNLLKSSQQ